MGILDTLRGVDKFHVLHQKGIALDSTNVPPLNLKTRQICELFVEINKSIRQSEARTVCPIPGLFPPSPKLRKCPEERARLQIP